MAEPILTIFGV